MTNELRPPLTVEEWIKERHANCIRIAATKPEGFDKAGWLEDAAYFQSVLITFRRQATVITALADALRDYLDWWNDDTPGLRLVAIEKKARAALAKVEQPT